MDDGILTDFVRYMSNYMTVTNSNRIIGLIKVYYNIDLTRFFLLNSPFASPDPRLKSIGVYEASSDLKPLDNYAGYDIIGRDLKLVDDIYIEKLQLLTKLSFNDNSPLYLTSKGIYIGLFVFSELDVDDLVPDLNVPVIEYQIGVNYFTVRYEEHGIAQSEAYVFRIPKHDDDEGDPVYDEYTVWTVADDFPLHVLKVNNLGDIPFQYREFLWRMVLVGKLYIFLPNLVYLYEIIYSKDRACETNQSVAKDLLFQREINDWAMFKFYDTTLSVIKQVGNEGHIRLLQYILPDESLKSRVVGGGIFSDALKDKLIPYKQNVFCPGPCDEEIENEYLYDNPELLKVDSNIVNVSNRIHMVNEVGFFGVDSVDISPTYEI